MTKWKEKISSLFQSISQAFHNHRYFEYPLTKKRIILLITSITLCLTSIVMLALQNQKTSQLLDQGIKSRWTDGNDYAEITLFFPVGAEIKETLFINAEHTIEKALQADSLMAEGHSQRIFVDCYYEKGTVDVSRDGTKLTLPAYGVSKDFFLFHPMEFVSGAGIPSDVVMRDLVVIDEKTAWDLFGALDVTGMTIQVGGKQHLIAGVIKRADDRLSELAGNTQSTIYVSTSTLEEFGTSYGYAGFEICMPELYGGYALDMVKKTFNDYEKTGEFLDNSKRYEYKNLFWNIKNIRARHMQTKTVMYPYWENVARYYDAHYANLCIVRLGLFLIAVGIWIYFVISIWRHRLFHRKDLKEWMIHFMEKQREKKKAKPSNSKRQKHEWRS